MGRGCCYPGCPNRDGSGVSFYSFPKDDERRNAWLRICNLKDFRKSFKVCSVHFPPHAFRDSFDGSKGLLYNAVPLSPASQPATDEIEYLEECEPEVRLFLEAASTKPELDYKVLYLQEKVKLSQKELQLQQAQEKAKRLAKKNKRLQNLLKARRAQIKELKKITAQQSKETQEERKCVQALRNNPFLYESVKNGQRHKQGRRYTVSKLITSKIKLTSTSGYKALRDAQVLVIPHPRTISKWHQDMSIKPGFNSGLLKRMKNAGIKMDARDKVVAVLIDGMAIRPDVTYHSKSDTFAGFPDDGSNPEFENNDPERLATEAVTIMARSIHSNYKQILGYFLAESVIESNRQGDILKEAIRLLRQIGFTPVVVIMDQHPSNCKMIRLLGATVDVPVFEVDGQNVVAMYDNPHLMKSVRNNLLTKDFNYKNCVVSFDDLLKFYEIDSQRNPRLAPKFDRKCLIEGTFDKMNVGYVTHVFSETLASSMETLIELGELPQEMIHTSSFLRDMDTFFDIFNSKSPTDESKPFREAIKDGTKQWEFLDNFKESIENSFFVPKSSRNVIEVSPDAKNLTSSQKKPPCLKGIVQNINALPILWRMVQNLDFEYLCTNKVTQDALENSFAAARRSCGSNDSPSANEFGVAVRHYSCRKTLDDFYGTNCEPDDTCTEHAEVDETETNSEYDPIEEDPLPFLVRPFEPLDEDAELPSLPALNSLMFIIGYAVSKLEHDECKTNLTEGANHTSQKYLFLRMKTAANNGKLTVPNDLAFEIGSMLMFAMEQKFTSFLRQSKTGIRHRLKQYVCYEDFSEKLCNACFDDIVERILNTLLGGQTRKIMNNYNKRNTAAARSKSRKGKRKGITKEATIPRKVRKIDDLVPVSSDYCEASSEHPTLPPVVSQTVSIENIAYEFVDCQTSDIDESSGQQTLQDGVDPCLNVEFIEYDDEDDQVLDKSNVELKVLPTNYDTTNTQQDHQKERIIRNLDHLSLDDIAATFEDHRDELSTIFERFKRHTQRSLMKNNSLLNWELATNLASLEQAYYMAMFLENNLVPDEDRGRYTEFIDMILIWEWAVRIIMSLYNYTRDQALQQIKLQEYESILNGDYTPPDKT